MARKRKPTSPVLDLTITDEQRHRSIAGNSGGCLIADAIKTQYPHLTGIVVDMATVRITDRAAGYRYTYLTPANAQHVLLAFDQGWPNPTDRLTIKRAVKITPITRGRNVDKSRTEEQRAARLAELEEKEAAGTTNPHEKAALTRMRNPKPRKQSPERPTSTGPSQIDAPDNGSIPTVIGGAPIPQGPSHPNLLRGRNRHFGAKLADPGQAFNEAVEAEMTRRRHEADNPGLFSG
jgi:hypothetical protein